MSHKIDKKRLYKEVESITKQLINKYSADKVILFGSTINKKFDSEKSDLDFLIIKSDVPRLGRERVYELDKLIDYKIAADFIVYTPSEIDKLKMLNDPFLVSIFKEGKTLYDKSLNKPVA